MPKKFLIIAALLLVLCSQAFAISAQEAIDFATKQNNFVYSGENPEDFKAIRITDSGKGYWVIIIPSGNSIKGIIPVLDSQSPILPNSLIARGNLIETAYFLWNYASLKTDVAEQAKQVGLNLWLFDAASVSDFLQLSADLKNEKTDLTTVKSELKDFPELQQDVDSLILMLDEMRALADALSDSLLETASLQTRFENEPDTNSLEEFEKIVDGGFNMVDELETLLIHDPDEKQQSYFEKLEELRQDIAKTDLQLETKQGLNALANVPNSVQKFNSKTNFFVSLEDRLDQIFINTHSSKIDALSADLATREKRNTAYLVLYARDEEIYEKTGQPSLNALFSVLLSNDYYYDWSDQAELAEAKADWEKAVSYYETGAFQPAGQYAAKAKTSGIKVYEAGLKEDESGINNELIINGIIVLVVAFIAIYAIKNRGKILGAISQKEEENQFNDWEK